MPGADTRLQAFFSLHNLSSSGDIINPCHCQKAAVSSNIISPATVKYHPVPCINYAVNHGRTAMLFYNNVVNNLCLDHKSVSPATAPINNSNFETEKIFLFACKTVLIILALHMSSNYILTCSVKMGFEWIFEIGDLNTWQHLYSRVTIFPDS